METQHGEVIPAVTAIDKDQWRPEEEPLLWHFLHFKRLVDAVTVESGPLQGWFSRPLWRQYSYAPFNARVMENYYSLAFFYAHDAPWNCYYRHPAVLERLRLTLEYTLALAGPRGALPEYAPAHTDTPMLAPSSFGAEYLAAVLDRAGPLLPGDLRARVVAAARDATTYVLTAEESWTHARSFSNQFLGALVAARKLARLTGDQGLLALAERGGRGVLEEFGAAPGYLYENDGADTFGYFFVSLYRLIPLHHEWPDPCWSEVVRRQGAWMARWMLPEPDGDTILLAGAHHTRTAGRDRITAAPESLPAILVPSSGPYANRWGHGAGALLAGAEADERRFLRLAFPPVARQEAWHRAWRDEPDLIAAADWHHSSGEYPPVSTLSGYPPYAPTDAAWREDRAALPCHAATPVTETLRDDRGNQYTFVRQPRYYAGFAFATRRSVARLGPSFLWLPDAGTVILSYNARARYPGLCWETTLGERGTGSIPASALVRDEGGATEISIDYGDLGCHKAYVLRPEGIDVRLSVLRADGANPTERVPLLLREDDLLRLDYGTCPVADLYERDQGMKVVTRHLAIERRGCPILRFDFHAPVVAQVRRFPARDGLVAVELRFPFAPVFYGRSGYRLLLGAG